MITISTSLRLFCLSLCQCLLFSEQLCNSLSTAIQSGDQMTAIEVLRKVSQQKLPLSIKLKKPTHFTIDSGENAIRWGVSLNQLQNEIMFTWMQIPMFLSHYNSLFVLCLQSFKRDHNWRVLKALSVCLSVFISDCLCMSALCPPGDEED